MLANPWDADPTADNERTFPVAAPAVSAPAAQPASTRASPPPPTATVAARAAAPAQTRPHAGSGRPGSPGCQAAGAKEIEPPHAIDLAARDDLWDRIAAVSRW